MDKFKNLCALLLILATSCKPRTFNTDLQHNKSDLTTPYAFARWITLTDDEVKKIYLHAFPPSHVANQRLNYWANAIDTELRKNFPDKFKHIGKPLVIVEHDTNAGSMGLTLCVPVTTRFPSMTVGSPKSNVGIGVTRTGKITTIEKSACTFRPQLSKNLKELVATAQSFLDKDCKIEIQKNEVHFKGNTCTKDIDHDGTAIGSFLAFSIQTQVIMFGDEFIKAFANEHEMVAMLAHEMAHFYKAHNSVATRNYNFAYRVASKQDKRPSPEPSLEPLLAQLKTLVHEDRAMAWELATKVPEQQLSSTMVKAIAGYLSFDYSMPTLIGQACGSGTGCKTACQAYLSTVKDVDSELMKTLLRQQFEFDQFNQKTQKQVLKLENDFLQCAKVVKLSSKTSQETLDANTVTQKTLNYGFVKKIINTPLPDFTTLDKLIIEVSARYEKSTKIAADIFRKAAEERLGYYTVEQEADEVGVEALTLVGISPLKAVELHVHYAVHTEKGYADGGSDNIKYYALLNSTIGRLTGQKCLELHHRNWKNTDGSPTFITPNDFTYEHHSSCYRAFNLWQELVAHEYVVKNKDVYKAPGQPWELFVSQF